jgi:nucleotide-binding universal stress UspA family protein
VAKEIDSADAEEAERLAAEGARLAREAGLEASPVVVEQDGKPWQTLIACAEEHDAGALVTGARGQTGLASALLGSTSTGLLHHSPVPVLVVPAAASDTSHDGPALLCFDGSDDAEHAIAVAGELLGGKDARVLNLWLDWLEQTPRYLPGVSGAVAGMARELNDIAASQSSTLADSGSGLAVEHGLRAEPMSRRGSKPVWRHILDAADECDASVRVLGARGLSGMSSVLGSVSHGVVHHARRPVLVVPAAEQRVDTS